MWLSVSSIRELYIFSRRNLGRARSNQGVGSSINLLVCRRVLCVAGRFCWGLRAVWSGLAVLLLPSWYAGLGWEGRALGSAQFMPHVPSLGSATVFACFPCTWKLCLAGGVSSQEILPKLLHWNHSVCPVPPLSS